MGCLWLQERPPRQERLPHGRPFQPLVSLYYPVPGWHPPSLSALGITLLPSARIASALTFSPYGPIHSPQKKPHLMVAHKQQWPPLWDEAQTPADLPGLGVRREEHGADLHKSGKGEGG